MTGLPIDTHRFRATFPALAAALLAGALFAVTLGGTYIYDDFDVFSLDPRLREPASWGQYWTESYNFGVDNLYRPLVSMTYALQWWLHGGDAQMDQADAWKYHSVNVLLHMGVSALVAELARRLIGRRAAWIAGLLFASHPIHVEAVANIVGRAELMCALGIVGALVLFTRPLTTLRALGITACFALALLSKEQGMLTPVLLLILALVQRFCPFPLSLRERDRVRGGENASDANDRTTRHTGPPHPNPLPEGEGVGSRRAKLLLIILLTWGLAVYIAFREAILPFAWERHFLDWTINPLVRADADRSMMPLVLLGRYAALLVAPLKLSIDYGAMVMGWRVAWMDPYLYLGAAAIIAWFVWFVLALLRRRGVEVFCLLALALTYGLVSNFLLLIGTNFGERLMYTPSVFFVMLATALLVKLPRRAMVAVVAVVLILFCVRSFTYAQRWNDRLRFYEIGLRERPESIRLHLLLTNEYLRRGRIEDAERIAESASSKLPAYWEVWIARAVVAQHRGDLAAAERHLFTAAETDKSPTARIAGMMGALEKQRAATQPATTQ